MAPLFCRFVYAQPKSESLTDMIAGIVVTFSS